MQVDRGVGPVPRDSPDVECHAHGLIANDTLRHPIVGDTVTTELSQSLEDCAAEALAIIAAFESRLTSLSSQVDELRQQLDSHRARVQREREELDIEYSLESGSTYVVEAPGTDQLRTVEHMLIDRTIRASRLYRQLTEFTALISTTQRQFISDDELMGSDAATQAAIRSAAALAQEVERQRLAREIHDGPAQALANAVIALEFVERAIRSGGELAQSRSLEEVERIKTTLREGLTEIRRFIFDLRPTMLQDRGLAATVEHYVATYQSLFPMPIELRIDPKLPRLSHDQELAAFRVIQESIQNARKHARATHTYVDVARRDTALLISIVDDGRGFSPDRVIAHTMGGAGLTGMRERAALVGGQLTIFSEPGEGTRVELHIPLRVSDSQVFDAGSSPRIEDGDPPTDLSPEPESLGHGPA